MPDLKDLLGGAIGASIPGGGGAPAPNEGAPDVVSEVAALPPEQKAMFAEQAAGALDPVAAQGILDGIKGAGAGLDIGLGGGIPGGGIGV